MVECLEALQPTCRLYIQFFPFRHLVSSFRKTIDWLCNDLRGRFRSTFHFLTLLCITVCKNLNYLSSVYFLALLNDFDCLETSRRKAISLPGQTCYHPHIPVNIWLVIKIKKATGLYITVASMDENFSSTVSYRSFPGKELFASKVVQKCVGEFLLLYL